MNVGTVGGGTAIIDPPDGPYLEGTEVTVTAKPEGDWQFIGWEGDSTSSEATITITMDEVKALTATFGTNGRFWKPLKYLLNVIDNNDKFGKFFACGIVKQRHNWMYSQCYPMSKLSLRL